MVLPLVAACNALNFFSRIVRSETSKFTIHIFFMTAVLRKLFDIRFSDKHCNGCEGDYAGVTYFLPFFHYYCPLFLYFFTVNTPLSTRPLTPIPTPPPNKPFSLLSPLSPVVINFRYLLKMYLDWHTKRRCNFICKCERSQWVITVACVWFLINDTLY